MEIPKLEKPTGFASFEDLKARLLAEFPDVFSDSLSSTPMAGPDMKIHLVPNAKPLKVMTARTLPLRWTDIAQKLVDQLCEQMILAPVDIPTEWCSPGFFVPKPDGKRLRLVTDFKELNKYVRRPVHLFPSSTDIIQSIPADATCFFKADATSGYFQKKLDEESSYLTTFILPFGRYRYLRAPMGLNASSDEWCFTSDVIVIGLAWVRKIVDDLLAWARSLMELYDRVVIILTRCRVNNITLSISKLEVSDSLIFAGHLVTSNGIKPDPAKTESISKFKTPSNITELRSFLGLANQLGFFIPDLAHIAAPLRPLLKKNVAYVWLDEHQAAFERLRAVLTSPLVVRPYDMSEDVATYLFCDASRLGGLGFALMQRLKADARSPHWMIMCGSRSLSSAERNYAMVELECLAIQWAIDKCHFYLRGAPPFTVVSDHSALLGLIAKNLNDVGNARVQRLMEKMRPYTFEIKWVAGTKNAIADCLSRSPYFEPPETDDITVIRATPMMDNIDVPALKNMASAASDPSYQSIVNAILQEKPHKLSHSHPATPYRQLWPRLSIKSINGVALILLDGQRLVVPISYRPALLKLLHKTHSGQTKTYQLARQAYHWPGMFNDIKTMISACDFCQRRLPSQAKLPMISNTVVPSRPMSHVGTDIGQTGGNYYLIMVDRFSGFPWVLKLRSTSTEGVTNVLRSWFMDFGFPEYLRSDKGPQFRSEEFVEWCKKNYIVHETSSAYYPESNGLAEAGVKQMKKLIAAENNDRTDLQSLVLLYRNSPSTSGYSPAQLFFGRSLKTSLPSAPFQFLDFDMDEAVNARQDAYDLRREYHDQHRAALPPLCKGDPVLVQNPISNAWDSTGIEAVRASGNSYDVLLNGGRITSRNRKFLRPIRSESNPLDHAEEEKEGKHQQIPCLPRRSERLRKAQSTLTCLLVRTSITPPPSPSCARASPSPGHLRRPRPSSTTRSTSPLTAASTSSRSTCPPSARPSACSSSSRASSPSRSGSSRSSRRPTTIASSGSSGAKPRSSGFTRLEVRPASPAPGSKTSPRTRTTSVRPPGLYPQGSDSEKLHRWGNKSTTKYQNYEWW